MHSHNTSNRRGHVADDFLLGHYWAEQEECDLEVFCLFCGNCDGRCATKVGQGKVVGDQMDCRV